MADFRLNQIIKRKQYKAFAVVVIAAIVIFLILLSMLAGGKTKAKSLAKEVDLTGIVDESFSEANTTSALVSQQTELEALRHEVKILTEKMTSSNKAYEEQVATLAKEIQAKNERQKEESPAKALPDEAAQWQIKLAQAYGKPIVGMPVAYRKPNIHAVRFQYKPKDTLGHLNPDHYVPSGTFAKAVVLGGADADASVNGQSKNNGVMLFKIISPGNLPNGQRSHLNGCFLTASSWGDISSERAYVILDKLSCARQGEPIIDKSVAGWAFFAGKVGIKGMPMMRDKKVVQWAGFSGALSGIASAAQYAQSVQSFSGLGGAVSVVPSGNIGPYAAYGGASKAADMLSEYYIKRAEQYHPVIQVGAGNKVTIVFKDGFYLEPDEKSYAEDRKTIEQAQGFSSTNEIKLPTDEKSVNLPESFTLSPDVLTKANVPIPHELTTQGEEP